MISSCANPACRAPFQYLRDGRLYRFELTQPATGPHLAGGKEPGHKLEHFWLCGRCAPTMTLELEHRHKVVVVYHKNSETRRAAAS